MKPGDALARARDLPAVLSQERDQVRSLSGRVRDAMAAMVGVNVVVLIEERGPPHARGLTSVGGVKERGKLPFAQQPDGGLIELAGTHQVPVELDQVLFFELHATLPWVDVS